MIVGALRHFGKLPDDLTPRKLQFCGARGRSVRRARAARRARSATTMTRRRATRVGTSAATWA
eukprot:1676139-Alexandrium_andersonii.AAC.1